MLTEETMDDHILRTCANPSCARESSVPKDYVFCANCGFKFRGVVVDNSSTVRKRPDRSILALQHVEEVMTKKKALYGVGANTTTTMTTTGSPPKQPSTIPKKKSPLVKKPSVTGRMSRMASMPTVWPLDGRTANNHQDDDDEDDGGLSRTRSHAHESSKPPESKQTDGFLPQIMNQFKLHVQQREEFERVVREQVALARFLEVDPPVLSSPLCHSLIYPLSRTRPNLSHTSTTSHPLPTTSQSPQLNL